MATNLDKPDRWRTDIAESVKAHIPWFPASAPKPYSEQRELATAQVHDAMSRPGNLTANPIIRNAQEQRQLESVEGWLTGGWA